jgi:DNA-binding NarL/FixJ family response regulator
MSRPSGHTTARGERWLAELTAAQQAVEAAKRARDQLVHEALRDGLGVRGVAKALQIDKATVSRRYGQGTAR